MVLNPSGHRGDQLNNMPFTSLPSFPLSLPSLSGHHPKNIGTKVLKSGFALREPKLKYALTIYMIQRNKYVKNKTYLLVSEVQ